MNHSENDKSIITLQPSGKLADSGELEPVELQKKVSDPISELTTRVLSKDERHYYQDHQRQPIPIACESSNQMKENQRKGVSLVTPRTARPTQSDDYSAPFLLQSETTIETGRGLVSSARESNSQGTTRKNQNIVPTSRRVIELNTTVDSERKMDDSCSPTIAQSIPKILSHPVSRQPTFIGQRSTSKRTRQNQKN